MAERLVPEGEGSASPRVLGQLLCAAGVVGEPELAAALVEQRRVGGRLGEVLVRRGLDAETVARALATQLRLPYAAPPLVTEGAALEQVERTLALRHRIVPLALVSRGIRVATADPLDLGGLDDLRFQTGRRVEPVVATAAAIEEALGRAYGAWAIRRGAFEWRGGGGSAGERAGEGGSDGGSDGEEAALREASEAPPTVALVDLILERGAALRASDIHIEPAAGRLRVRARVDGVLCEVLELPERTSAAVVSRLKVLAGMDIAVKRRPQDGRGVVRVEGRELTLRVSTLPAQGGEKVVLRLLDPENAGRKLEEVGLDFGVRGHLEHLLGRGHGVLLVTGPTGSGKTTTLYAALASLDRERRNVVTVEDPVEYKLPGLTQVQVHRRAGLGFAAALRALLRQDPDVIMVGELRDKETVEVAMAAALTGHLVLSTLHTNDAPGAIARLTEMGAAPYLIAGGLIGILAQRLARRLCTHCREEREGGVAELAELGVAGERVRLFVSRGCVRCGGSGYRGRTGIFELLTVDARIRSLILRRAPADVVRDAARAGGMTTLGHDAWSKVRSGTTSLDEVRPLLALLADEAPACTSCGVSLRAEFLMCPGCGKRLRERCGCGVLFEEGWRCCPKCGRGRGGGEVSGSV